MMVVMPLLVVLIGQFCHDVIIGRQDLQNTAVTAMGSLVRPTIGRLFYCYFQSVIVCRCLSVSFGAMYESFVRCRQL